MVKNNLLRYRLLTNVTIEIVKMTLEMSQPFAASHEREHKGEEEVLDTVSKDMNYQDNFEDIKELGDFQRKEYLKSRESNVGRVTFSGEGDQISKM